MSVRKLSFSGIVVAVYILLTFFFASFSFGFIQARLSTGLYALAYYYPFLCLPLSLANGLANLFFGGMGIADALGGFFIGLITTTCIIMGKKIQLPKWISLVFVTIIPAFIAPIWLSTILEIPYYLLVISLTSGQLISSLSVGVLMLYSHKIKNVIDKFLQITD